ncbi:hypothetical protein [Rothia sp. (in: high G+C Gram-positive bacteria)]|uniref:hypothetical protein n=1 Tax=Rothia sp. (in: high G+C Gram-positive bacteria) TaxID=1885016 RepID=UPI000EC983A4|nr:hypothetical protein [Rothia sp. (in: high G+C Gram-positive bacteria)]
MPWLYPTFSSEVAQAELKNLENRYRRTSQVFTSLGVMVRHPKANYPSSGGDPVPRQRLFELRDTVLQSVAQVDPEEKLSTTARNRAVDRVLSQVLGEWFEQEEDRGNVARPQMWSYLALVVLPDVAISRFPARADGSLQRERFLEGRRNIFYRLYLRYVVLGGDVLSDEDVELFEDELVGLVDRNLSADHRLSQAIARKISSLVSMDNRRERVRRGFKNVQFELKVTDLSSVSSKYLEDIVDKAFS